MMDLRGGEDTRKNKSQKKSIFDIIQKKKDLKKFKRKLRAVGLGVHQMQGDGNCLFRSIADQLSGSPGKYQEYRKAAVECLKSNPDEYRVFIDENFDDYLKKMAKDGSWGGNIELNALARQYKVNIVVHQIDDGVLCLKVHEPLGSVPTIHVSYHRGRHYNSVRRLDDPILKDKSPMIDYPIDHDLQKTKAIVDSRRLTREEIKEIRQQSRQVYDDTIQEALTEQVFNYFGFMVSGDNVEEKKSKIRKHTDNVYWGMNMLDRNQTVQKTFGLVRDNPMNSDSSDSEDDYEKIVPEELKEKYENLQADDQIIIDVNYCELYNLKLKKGPSKTSICPCPENTELTDSGAGKNNTYENCCMNIDRMHKKKILEEIKAYFEEQEKDDAPKYGQEMVFI